MKMPPKVAVLLSGQPRLFKKTFDSVYKNLILPYNADVFIHTWFDKTNLCMDSIDSKRHYEALQENDDKALIEMYKPKKYIIEKQLNFYNENLQIPSKYFDRVANMNPLINNEDIVKKIVHITHSMFYSMFKCNELRYLYSLENNIIYDYVIWLRFDIALSEPIILENFDVTKGIYTHNLLMNEQLPNGWMIIGNSLTMNIVLSIYLHMEYLNTFKYFHSENRDINYHYPSNTCTWGDEHFIKDICRLFNIQIYLVNNIPMFILYA
jgi:hypothetical protein